MKTFSTLLLVCLVWCAGLNAQHHYFYAGSGLLTQTWNWNTSPDGSGIQPSGFTNSSDTFQLFNTDVQVTSSWTIAGKLIIGNGVDSTYITIPSTAALNASCIVLPFSVMKIQHTTVPSFDSIYPFTQIEYLAEGNQTLSNKMYYSLLVSGIGFKTSTGNLLVSHSITVNGILDINSSNEMLSGALTSIYGTGILRTTSSLNPPFPANLSWPFTVEFYRNGNQNIPQGSYTSLLITGNTGTKSYLGDTLTINSLLTIKQGNTLSLGNALLNGNISIINGRGNLSTTNASSTPLPNQLNWDITVVYNASAAGQTIVSGTYRGLSITSGTNTNIANGNILMNDSATFQVSSANILDMQQFLLQFGNAVAISGAGTLKTKNTSAYPIPPNRDWTMSVTYYATELQTVMPGNYKANLNINGGPRLFNNNTYISLGGNLSASLSSLFQFNLWELDLTGNAQTVTIPSNYLFSSLTCSGVGTKTVSNPIMVATKLTILSGAILNLGNFMLSGEFTTIGTSQGILRFQGNGMLPSNKTWNFKIQFDGNIQTIPGGTYSGGLTLSGGNKSMQNDIEVNDTLTISSNGVLVIGSHTLHISGCLNQLYPGWICGGYQSSIEILPSSYDAGILYMLQTNDSSRSLKNIIMNRYVHGNELLLGNELRIIESVRLLKGNLYSGNNLVFTSSNSHDAVLEKVADSAFITGSVKIEKLIPAINRNNANRWHFLSSSVNTDENISRNWQQKIHITGNGNNGKVCPDMLPNDNGFDQNANGKSSFFNWNENTQQWDSLYSTLTQKLHIGKGYRVFVRGNRNRGCALLNDGNENPDDVILTASGNLITGNFSTVCSADSGRYTLIGNPYQSVIDLMSEGIQFNNLLPVIYTFRNDLSPSGKYARYSVGENPDSADMSRFIAPGQAFFVQTANNGSASISFTENCKMPPTINQFFIHAGLISTDVRHGEKLKQPINEINITCDPFHSILVIENKSNKNHTVVLTNLKGKDVWKCTSEPQSRRTFSLPFIEPGVYLAHTQNFFTKVLFSQPN